MVIFDSYVKLPEGIHHETRQLDHPGRLGKIHTDSGIFYEKPRRNGKSLFYRCALSLLM